MLVEGVSLYDRSEIIPLFNNNYVVYAFLLILDSWKELVQVSRGDVPHFHLSFDSFTSHKSFVS